MNKEKRRQLKNKFRNKRYIHRLREFLVRVEQKKPQGGGLDLDIMRFLKTSARFMEAASSLMSLGIPYKNIYWPLQVTFYGIPGRPLAIKQEDINKIKDIIKALRPKMVVFNGEGFPDFGSHSNTEIGTYIALFELLKERRIKKHLVLFQWAGVWDRIETDSSEICVVLTKQELQDLSNAFNYFYPTQAPYAPVLNPSSDFPQSFAQDVIVNAYKSGYGLINLVDLPKDIKMILKKEAGVLNYKVARLADAQTKQEFINKREELLCSQLSLDISSNTALTGPPPYPERLNELSSSLIGQMSNRGAISVREKKLFGYQDAFGLSSEDMIKIINAFHKEMEAGLKGKEGTLAMLPTFVGIPTGKEKGVFLALDLGGTTFRVLMVYLRGANKKPKIIIERYNLRTSQKEKKRGIDYDYTRGSKDELFAALVRYIKRFLTKHEKFIARYKHKKPYPLGFTFSFSVTMKDIDRVVVNKMSKEFNITDLSNQDVVQCLREALNKAGIDNLVKVVSLNNDTVGALVAKGYHDPECDIGGIVGTGTNFCYLESVENIHTLTDEQKASYGRKAMIVNIESGNFNKITQNAYDRLLDKNSLNKTEHITEKMVSGLYLGELTRLALVELVKNGLLFKTALRKDEMVLLAKKNSFKTSFYDKIAEDDTDTLKGVQAQLIQWGIKSQHISLEDARIVKELCREIAQRSARITAAVVFAIVTHIDKQVQNHHTVAMDGSLFEKYRHFKDDMVKAIRQISMQMFHDDRSNNITFQLSPDGSGIGAAIICAIAASQKRISGN